MQTPLKSTSPMRRQPSSSAGKPWQCTWPFDGRTGEPCTKAFGRKSDLQRHVHTHTGTRNHACPYKGCTKTFIQTSALTVHIRTHTGEKPHRCGECGKRFSDSSSLARHRKIHLNERPYPCKAQGCDKSFCRKSTLNKHMQRDHQAEYQSTEDARDEEEDESDERSSPVASLVTSHGRSLQSGWPLALPHRLSPLPPGNPDEQALMEGEPNHSSPSSTTLGRNATEDMAASRVLPQHHSLSITTNFDNELDLRYPSTTLPMTSAAVAFHNDSGPRYQASWDAGVSYSAVSADQAYFQDSASLSEFSSGAESMATPYCVSEANQSSPFLAHASHAMPPPLLSDPRLAHRQSVPRVTQNDMQQPQLATFAQQPPIHCHGAPGANSISSFTGQHGVQPASILPSQNGFVMPQQQPYVHVHQPAFQQTTGGAFGSPQPPYANQAILYHGVCGNTFSQQMEEASPLAYESHAIPKYYDNFSLNVDNDKYPVNAIEGEMPSHVY